MRTLSRSIATAFVLTASIASGCSSDSSTVEPSASSAAPTSPAGETTELTAAVSASTVPESEPPATTVSGSAVVTVPASVIVEHEVPASAEAEADASIEALRASFDPDDIDALVTEAAELDRTVELAMAEWSGLESALGGPEPTKAAFAAQDEMYAPLTEAVSGPPALGFRAVRADGPNIGAGLFGGFMVIGLSSGEVVKATNDGSIGTATPGTGVTITATPEAVEIAVDVTHESDGMTTSLKTNVKLVPCPDVNGEFTIEASVVVSASAGGAQQNGKLEVKVTGQLNDNADLASSSSDFRLRRDGLDDGAFVDSSVSYASDGTASTKLNDFNWFVGDVAANFEANTRLAAIFGLLIQSYLLDAAEAGYLSGRCVEIAYGVSPGTSGLEPGSGATITARPRGKFDGVPTGGTVQALLSAGGKSVDPSSTPIPVVAEFQYGAPDEPNQTGTVSLQARSKRGVGRVDISFDTKGRSYVATYDGGGISITGTIADLSKPFETVGVITGGTLTFHFVPVGTESGSVSHNDPCGGPECVAEGSGTYTIADNGVGDGTLTMTVTMSSCVTVTAGFSTKTCRDSVLPVLLTPA